MQNNMVDFIRQGKKNNLKESGERGNAQYISLILIDDKFDVKNDKYTYTLDKTLRIGITK